MAPASNLSELIISDGYIISAQGFSPFLPFHMFWNLCILPCFLSCVTADEDLQAEMSE